MMDRTYLLETEIDIGADSPTTVTNPNGGLSTPGSEGRDGAPLQQLLVDLVATDSSDTAKASKEQLLSILNRLNASRSALSSGAVNSPPTPIEPPPTVASMQGSNTLDQTTKLSPQSTSTSSPTVGFSSQEYTLMRPHQNAASPSSATFKALPGSGTASSGGGGGSLGGSFGAEEKSAWVHAGINTKVSRGRAAQENYGAETSGKNGEGKLGARQTRATRREYETITTLRAQLADKNEKLKASEGKVKTLESKMRADFRHGAFHAKPPSGQDPSGGTWTIEEQKFRNAVDNFHPESLFKEEKERLLKKIAAAEESLEQQKEEAHLATEKLRLNLQTEIGKNGWLQKMVEDSSKALLELKDGRQLLVDRIEELNKDAVKTHKEAEVSQSKAKVAEDEARAAEEEKEVAVMSMSQLKVESLMYRQRAEQNRLVIAEQEKRIAGLQRSLSSAEHSSKRSEDELLKRGEKLRLLQRQKDALEQNLLRNAASPGVAVNTVVSALSGQPVHTPGRAHMEGASGAVMKLTEQAERAAVEDLMSVMETTVASAEKQVLDEAQAKHKAEEARARARFKKDVEAMQGMHAREVQALEDDKAKLQDKLEQLKRQLEAITQDGMRVKDDADRHQRESDTIIDNLKTMLEVEKQNNEVAELDRKELEEEAELLTAPSMPKRERRKSIVPPKKHSVSVISGQAIGAAGSVGDAGPTGAAAVPWSGLKGVPPLVGGLMAGMRPDAIAEEPEGGDLSPPHSMASTVRGGPRRGKPAWGQGAGKDRRVSVAGSVAGGSSINFGGLRKGERDTIEHVLCIFKPKEQVKEITRSVGKLSEMLYQILSENESLKGEIAAARGELQAKEAEEEANAQKLKRFAESAQQLREEHHARAEAEERLAAAAAQNAALQARVAELAEENNDIKAKQLWRSKRVADLTSRLEDLQAELDSERHARAHTDTECSKLNERMRMLRKRNEKLEKSLDLHSVMSPAKADNGI